MRLRSRLARELDDVLGLTDLGGAALSDLRRVRNPVPGVTLSIEGTALSAQSDAQGQFTIANLAPGPITLLADGATTTRPGTWPALEFELVAVPGRDNRLERPVYLLPLDTANQLCVDGATMVELHKAHLGGWAAPPRDEWSTTPQVMGSLTGVARGDVRSQAHSAQPQRSRRTSQFHPEQPSLHA